MKKVLSVVGFVAIAICSGVLFSYYTTGKTPAQVRAEVQEEAADTVISGIQALNMVTVVTGVADTVMAGAGEYGQAVNLTTSCGVAGCTLTENHQHGMCGIDGCMEIGEHSHGVCEIAGCTETRGHQHNGVYCYPHSADDGHAYHTCGAQGCTQAGAHSHFTCGIDGCTQTGEHQHGMCGIGGCMEIGAHSHGESGGQHHRGGHGKHH